MAEYKIDTSELREYCGRLRAGDRVLLSGAVYTSRDAYDFGHSPLPFRAIVERRGNLLCRTYADEAR